MAVQKSKKSKSRKGMRRSHLKVAIPNIIYCECGEANLSHCACAKCGTYRGRQVTASTVE